MSREAWDALVAAYREKPGEYARAARAAKVGTQAARAAWLRGFTRPLWAQRPISEIIEEERIERRAEVRARELAHALAADERRKLRAEAVLDAEEERLREAQAVRAAMSSGISILAAAGALSNAMLPVIARSAQAISASSMSASEAMKAIRSLAYVGAAAGGIVRNAMELTRIHLGDPLGIVGAPPPPGPGVGARPAAGPTLDADLVLESFGGDVARFQAAAMALAQGDLTDDALRVAELAAGPSLRG